MRRLSIAEKESYKAWQSYILALVEESSINTSEPVHEQRARIEKLEAEPEEWFKYYFPSFASSEPAPFHKQASDEAIAQ